jgi:cytidylate kinase
VSDSAPLVIAIDGPAASGKGTLSARLSAHYGFPRLDSGRLYRATARRLRDAGADPDDAAAATRAAQAVTPGELDDPALGADDIAVLASRISGYSGVRAALLALQQDFAAHPPGGAGGAIIDGRDIGTQVCPHAQVKLFVTASLETRAERRLKQLQAEGQTSIKARVLHDMRERDARDSARALSPLKQAQDAHLVDTTSLNADQAFETARALIEAHRPKD